MSFQNRQVVVEETRHATVAVCDGCGKESTPAVTPDLWGLPSIDPGWYQVGFGRGHAAVHACSEACVLPAIDKLKAEASEVGVVR